MGHFYDDPDFSYQDYWKNRTYEHQCEVLAIRTLLTDRHFNSAIDIGGGFGRLSKLIAGYSRHTVLVEPSQKQRLIAKKLLKDTKIEILAGKADKTRQKDSSLDLAVLVRVMHHLPDINSTLAEVHRILKPGGVAVIEFASVLNLKSRISSLLSGRPILLVPIDRRRMVNVRNQTIPFVNHHPITFQKTLLRNGFSIQKILSVSNFRGLPLKSLRLEKILQPMLGKLYFGPSIFILAKRESL